MKRRMLFVMTVVLTTFSLVVAGQSTATAQTKSGTKTGYTQVVVDPAVYAVIAGAGITPAPIGGAKAFAYGDTLAARFPITGYALRNLSIKHSGGISLTAGSASISLSDFSIDLGRGKVSGVVPGVGRVDLFSIGFSSKPRLGLVSLRLTGTAAGALNSTFGVQAFAAGDTFGYATPKPFSRF